MEMLLLLTALATLGLTLSMRFFLHKLSPNALRWLGRFTLPVSIGALFLVLSPTWTESVAIDRLIFINLMLLFGAPILAYLELDRRSLR